MKYFDYLKKGVPAYIAAGFIMGIALFLVIILSRYNTHLQTVLKEMDSIGIKKARVRKEIAQIDALTEYFREHFDADVGSIDPDRLIFTVLDELKARLPDVSIRVGDLKREGGAVELPLSIQAPMENYNMIIDFIS